MGASSEVGTDRSLLRDISSSSIWQHKHTRKTQIETVRYPEEVKKIKNVTLSMRKKAFVNHFSVDLMLPQRMRIVDAFFTWGRRTISGPLLKNLFLPRGKAIEGTVCFLWQYILLWKPPYQLVLLSL